MADVFISYHIASAAHIVHKISADLESRGVSCWYSKTGVRGGEDFARTVGPEIAACRVFLLILDKGAVNSVHVESELKLAFDRFNRRDGIAILPFQVEQCEFSHWMSYYMATIQIINKTGKQPSFGEIRNVVERIFQIVQQEREAQERKKKEEEDRKRREEQERKERERKEWERRDKEFQEKIRKEQAELERKEKELKKKEESINRELEQELEKWKQDVRQKLNQDFDDLENRVRSVLGQKNGKTGVSNQKKPARQRRVGIYLLIIVSLMCNVHALVWWITRDVKWVNEENQQAELLPDSVPGEDMTEPSDEQTPAALEEKTFAGWLGYVFGTLYRNFNNILPAVTAVFSVLSLVLFSRFSHLKTKYEYEKAKYESERRNETRREFVRYHGNLESRNNINTSIVSRQYVLDTKVFNERDADKVTKTIEFTPVVKETTAVKTDKPQDQDNAKKIKMFKLDYRKANVGVVFLCEIFNHDEFSGTEVPGYKDRYFIWPDPWNLGFVPEKGNDLKRMQTYTLYHRYVKMCFDIQPYEPGNIQTFVLRLTDYALIEKDGDVYRLIKRGKITGLPLNLKETNE